MTTPSPHGDTINVYRIQGVLDAQGRAKNMASYIGSVSLLVNIAPSKCRLADRNYRSLVQLDAKYRKKGLRIVGFPCNQFGAQGDRLTATDVISFVHTGYGVDFEIMQTVDVNGAHAHPLYIGLKRAIGIPQIDWHFAKFLVSKSGRVLKGFPSHIDPLEIESDIVAAL